MSEIPQDLISDRRQLAIMVAHEMISGPPAVVGFIDNLVAELVDRTGERHAEIAQKLYRAIMAVNRKGMGEARLLEGVDQDRYLDGLSPEFKSSVRDYGRRLEERRRTGIEDKRPPATQPQYPFPPNK